MKKISFIALTLAGLLVLPACKKDKEVTADDGGIPNFKSLISVKDYTLDDWSKIPEEYVVTLENDPGCTDVRYQALKNVKIYADMVYLNLVVEFVPERIPHRELVPLHIYLNADGDPETGGGNVYFKDGTSEWLLEGFLYENKEVCPYNPALFHWWGAMGTGIRDQSDTKGWYWTDPTIKPSQENGWGADIPTGTGDLGVSQDINPTTFEIQLKRSSITKNWANTFTIGFDLAWKEEGDNWPTIGVLPNAADDPVTGDGINAMKASITIDPTIYE